MDKVARRRTAVFVAMVALIVMAGAAGLVAWRFVQPQSPGDTGSYLIPQGSMSDDEARAMLDRQADMSRITVSLRPKPELVGDQLHVNFVVPEENNGFSERLEIEQDGAEVYRSGIVQPGHVVEWGDAPAARAGSATATVYAVNASGVDSGNPVSVEVEIVEG